MAQADYVVANQSGANFRADLNDQLAAIATNNSGTTAPSPTYANMLWADTANGSLKIRNPANTDWLIVGSLNTPTLGLMPRADNTVVARAANRTGSTSLASWQNFNVTAITEETDPSSICSPGGVITVPTSNYYKIGAKVTLVATANDFDTVALGFRRNVTDGNFILQRHQFSPGVLTEVTLTGSTVEVLLAGDTITPQYFVAMGAGGTYNVLTARFWFKPYI